LNLSTLAEFTQYGRIFPLAKNRKPMKGWRWKTKSTQDLLVIEQWLEKFNDHPWGLIPTRVLVVDVDVKNGSPGLESIEAAGGLDETLTVRTPSGGFHYYYAFDSSVPYSTRNGFLPGVDIRYGDKGFIVLPFSKCDKGRYEVVNDVEGLELAPIPLWIREKLKTDVETFPSNRSLPKNLEEHNSLIKNNTTTRQHVLYTGCDAWTDTRDQVKFRFFRKKDNVKIYRKIPVKTMVDLSQSGFEYQLAIRLMNVGASDEEVLSVYHCWCRKHGLESKKRFISHVLPAARTATADYIADWNSKQPKRRKHGTTKEEILKAIRSGIVKPTDIVAVTNLGASAVRMQLKRLVAAGILERSGNGYRILVDHKLDLPESEDLQCLKVDPASISVCTTGIESVGAFQNCA